MLCTILECQLGIQSAQQSIGVLRPGSSMTLWHTSETQSLVNIISDALNLAGFSPCMLYAISHNVIKHVLHVA